MRHYFVDLTNKGLGCDRKSPYLQKSRLLLLFLWWEMLLAWIKIPYWMSKPFRCLSQKVQKTLLHFRDAERQSCNLSFNLSLISMCLKLTSVLRYKVGCYFSGKYPDFWQNFMSPVWARVGSWSHAKQHRMGCYIHYFLSGRTVAPTILTGLLPGEEW